MSLREYKKKRDFSKTAEPPPIDSPRAGTHRFVVQKHDASRLHYDFRLEMEGVLKSWAVPKGFPWVQGEKHLAVHVEDHPVEYAEFEGNIPKGQYGGGTVMLWDRGRFEIEGEEPSRALRQGKLHLRLAGEKLKGEWTLVRTRRDEEKEHWLMLKTGESVKPLSARSDNRSVATGRTMRQIAQDRSATWESDRAEPGTSGEARELKGTAAKKRASAGKKAAATAKTSAAKTATYKVDPTLGAAESKPRFVEPMKARLVEHPPQGSDWVYELKWDGYRALAVKDGERVELFSRNNKSLSGDFPEVCEAIAQLHVDTAVIDGEIVALDPEGRSSFQLLQARRAGRERPPIFYYAFDLLHLQGRDVKKLPLCDRKALLEELLADAPETVRYSAGLEVGVLEILPEIAARGLEGVIGKRRDARYEPGARSGAWVKVKCGMEQEFVIGGYTQPKGTREEFGAIHVGYFAGQEFCYAGKVGTGFDAATLRDMRQRLDPLLRKTCPFTDIPTKSDGKWTRNMTPAAMRAAMWVEPRIVCQVKFAEWTQDGALRQPVFLGIRDDKEPSSVVRERPVTV